MIVFNFVKNFCAPSVSDLYRYYNDHVHCNAKPLTIKFELNLCGDKFLHIPLTNSTVEFKRI